MKEVKKAPIERVTRPIQKFIQNEKAGGIVLGISVILALIIANSPLAEAYHHILGYQIGFQVEGQSYLSYNLRHWIDDGLMAIFFFVVGLELKREIVGGELANPRKAMLPIAAALGGMIVPAIIYLIFNPAGEVHSGWGIPMATDIAFALGVLYLLGDRIPLALKVFLTALAIVDDLGAVLVIAFFYTSDISLMNLFLGLAFLLIMFIGNKLGIRSILFYAIVGIGGVWTAFLLSGVHATIAAVLAAFMMPADVKLREHVYASKVEQLLKRFKGIDPNNAIPTLTNDQLHVLDEIKKSTDSAIPPLQKLEHSMHPFVSFVILPIFALANAGVSFMDIDPSELFSTNVALGVTLGLLLGKVLGIVGFTLLAVNLKIAPLPQGMNLRNLLGLGFVGAIGFTMSLFITSLAFSHEVYQTQAKVGIFAASLLGGFIGFFILRKSSPRN